MFFRSSRKNQAIFRNVFFVDDVCRHTYWPAKEFFYDLLREPATQVFGEAPGQSLRQLITNNRRYGAYSSLLGTSSSDDTSWVGGYEHLSDEFAKCLEETIASDLLVIGYELTPGLIEFFDQKKIPWVDIRISPIRFLPDLLIAVRTSLPPESGRSADYSIRSSEIRNVAVQLLASARYRERYRRMYDNEDMTDCPITYIIGQTPHDASLAQNGSFVRLSDYEDRLTVLLRDRDVVYLPHPAAPAWHREEECHFLSQITNKFSTSTIALYDAFCSEGDVEFIGLSSGSLQEAAFFDRQVTVLYQSICPLNYQDSTANHPAAYWQIPFQLFSTPDFLKNLLGLKTSAERLPLNQIRKNELRDLHDVWWGYAEVIGRPNALTHVQQRPLANQVESLEKKLSRTIMFFLKEPDYESEHYFSLYDRIFKWINGDLVRFGPDGSVRHCGDSVGKWWELSTSSLGSQEIYIVWNEGGWIDKVTGDSAWVQLKCTNNIGDQFTIKSLAL